MHEPSFLAGLELGKFLNRLQRLETGFSKLRADLDALTARLRRVAILTALWTFAILANVSTEKAADFAVEIVRAAWKR